MTQGRIPPIRDSMRMWIRAILPHLFSRSNIQGLHRFSGIRSEYPHPAPMLQVFMPEHVALLDPLVRPGPDTRSVWKAATGKKIRPPHCAWSNAGPSGSLLRVRPSCIHSQHPHRPKRWNVRADKG